MAWLALLLYLLGLLLAFGWRTVTQWRRTGDTGLRLDAGRPGTLRWWAKLLFVAALVLGFGGPVAALAGLPPLPGVDHRPLHLVGLVVTVIGIVATLAAQLAMGTSWRIGVDPTERTELVTHGAFALARNPIFTAMAATTLGLTLLVPNAVSVAAWLVLVLALQLQVRAVEEPYLLATHGEAYRRYAAGVGRFLPGLGRLERV
ncbi:isoprenylcysteine carboxylmethyltransferase family protein [Micromonospora sp. C28SCA-DRY-2]|uniref:methyltransferase family protein n=1 Tax=Micromonospora sp. C28SCA-DRY-2 TaxID=3059522 RepID=UPI002675A23E|nr:isoprenylcysteine carboxylmethyltransferase family protein [Micromonospora sp. C28SCA-DRY-2]MDO3703981.1 isoprenylcysteine carboxylmethyltransferase family protein [Micromonospora sp. C28SCA-DRY-2]